MRCLACLQVIRKPAQYFHFATAALKLSSLAGKLLVDASQSVFGSPAPRDVALDADDTNLFSALVNLRRPGTLDPLFLAGLCFDEELLIIEWLALKEFLPQL